MRCKLTPCFIDKETEAQKVKHFSKVVNLRSLTERSTVTWTFVPGVQSTVWELCLHATRMVPAVPVQ